MTSDAGLADVGPRDDRERAAFADIMARAAPRTLGEIGDRLNLSRERIRQIKPHVAAIERIARSGNVAVVFYQPAPANEHARQFVALLRGSERSSVVSLSRTKAARVFEGTSPPMYQWVTSRVPARGAKIVLVARGLILLVNHAPGRGFWNEPADIDWDEVVANLSPTNAETSAGRSDQC